jgi:hypothetical protein
LRGFWGLPGRCNRSSNPTSHPFTQEAGHRSLERAPYLAIFPGLAIGIVGLAFNLFGDAVRDLLDPRLRTRSVLFHTQKG